MGMGTVDKQPVGGETMPLSDMIVQKQHMRSGYADQVECEDDDRCAACRQCQRCGCQMIVYARGPVFSARKSGEHTIWRRRDVGTCHSRVQ